MELGRKLLGALEVAGVALFAVGLAFRSAHRCLRPTRHKVPITIKGQSVLVLGSDQPLGRELSLQLTQRGCQVACSSASALPPLGLPPGSTYYCCNPARQGHLSELSSRLANDMGQVDMVVWAGSGIQVIKEGRDKTQLDQIANIVSGDLMQHYRVVSQFVPILAQKSGGQFVAVDPYGMPSGSFAATGAALTALTDTLTRQMADSSCSGPVRITRVIRRPMRPGDEENVCESAAAILRAVEAGKTTVTLPSAKQYIINTLRYLKGEIRQIWHQNIMLRQWKLAS